MHKIILIDDDADTLAAIADHFAWDEMKMELVATADNGISGLQAIEKHKPDIVVIDIRMPGMDGLSVIRQVRQQGLYPYFIIISAYADFEYAQTALRLFVCDYLLKPFSPDDLEAALAKALKELELRIPERVLLRYGFPLMGSAACRYPAQQEKALMENLYAARKEVLGTALNAFVAQAFSQNDREDALACVSKLYSVLVRPLVERGRYLSGTPMEGIRWESKNLAESVHQFLAGILEETYALLHSEPTTNPAIFAAQDYIRGHLLDKFTLETVAKAVHITPNYLSSLFSKTLGVSFVGYVNRLRVEQAQELLHDLQTDPSRVAEQVGFSDEKYFNQVFKQCTGCTPQQYRRRFVRHAHNSGDL